MTETSLTLKWGTVKGWTGCKEGTLFREKLEAYNAISGRSASAMLQDNTQAHKDALCDVVDAVADAGGEIWNDWDGKIMTREQAKKYIQGYRK